MTVRERARWLGLVVVAVGALAVVGCGTKVTKANYDRITVGMNETEVRDILGLADETEESGNPGSPFGQAGGGAGAPTASVKKKTWKSGGQAIVVNFYDGRVSSKSSMGL